MTLKKAELINKGMMQDFSISKNSQEFAFENHNIRIITNNDSTSMSITNIQGPTKVNTVNLNGVILGKCILDKYVVMFTHEISTGIDRIYRLDLDNTDGEFIFNLKTLFEGTLNFDLEHLIDTLYYIENINVIKVYWTDGLNNPRFINIITPGERVDNEEDKVFTPYENAKIFDFYPVIDKTPEITLEKSTAYQSELTNGMAQYFISYYNENGAETLIAASSSPITIDYHNRGAKADDTQGSCAVIINITNIDTTFDFVRVYSAIRSSKSGELNVKIVRNIRINSSESSIKIVDDGINQEALSPAQLFYVGGQVLIAKTLTQKDGTLFLGNLVKDSATIPDDVYNKVNEAIRQYNESLLGKDLPTIFSESSDFIKSPFVSFNQDKEINIYDASLNIYYPYNRQVWQEASNYRTFKGGEIYRFGVQFQSRKGEWTEVMWIGDVECTKRPITFDDGTVLLNNAKISVGDLITNDIKEVLEENGLVNYRAVIADPVKHNGRKIKAQGVLCPSLFNLRNRLAGRYGHSSWVMRPRKGKISYHHLEPLVAYTAAEGAEIVTNYTTTYPNVTYDKSAITNKKTYVGITYIPSFTDRCVYVKYVEFTSDYVDNNMYGFTGRSDLNVVPGSTYEMTDNMSLSNLLEHVSEEEKPKIPSIEFAQLYRDDLSGFFKNFAKGLIVAISGFIGGWLVPVVGATIAFTTLGNFDTVNVSPNISESRLKEYIDPSVYDTLKEFEKGMLKKGVLLQPIRMSTMDYLNSVPIAMGISRVFSDVESYYYPGYYEGGEFKSYGIRTKSLPTVFRPDGYANGDRVYFQIYEKTKTSGAFNINETDYFVDESLLSLNSPDITEDTILTGDYKCRMVGYVPLYSNNYFDAQIEMSPAPYGELGGLSRECLAYINNNIYNYNPFSSGFLYKDLDPNEDTYTNYKCFLFGPGNIVGDTTHQVGQQKSILQKKQILNHSYSMSTVYFNDSTLENKVTYGANCKIFSEDAVNMSPILGFNFSLYEGNYSDAYIVKDMKHIHAIDVSAKPSSAEDFSKSNEMINVDFSSTPHAVLTLKAPAGMEGKTPLLPIIGLNNENRYLSIKDSRTSGENSKWQHGALSGNRGLIWNLYDQSFTDEYRDLDLSIIYSDTDIYSFPGCNNTMPRDALFYRLFIDREYNFKNNEKYLWQPYTFNKAIGINYIEGFYIEPSSDNAAKIESVLNVSNFKTLIGNYYNNFDNSNYHFYYRIPRIFQDLDGYYTHLRSNCPDVLEFIGGMIKYMVDTAYISSVGTYAYRAYSGSYFLLGLLYFFNATNSNDKIINEYYSDDDEPLVTKYYLQNKEGLSEAVEQFKNLFIDLYKHCSCYYQVSYYSKYTETEKTQYFKNISDGDIDTFKKQIGNTISNTYDKLCECLDSIVNIWGIDTLKAKPYAQSWNGSTPGEESDSRFTYYLVLGDDDGYDVKGLVAYIKEGIKTGYQDYLSANGHPRRATNWYFCLDKSIYSFDNNGGDTVIVDGYDNSKGYIRYNDYYWEYDATTGKLVRVSDQAVDPYYQDEIDYAEPEIPYLMMGELYSDIPYNVLYGGHSESSIKNLTWFPISNAYPITKDIDNTFGDTYYQRFDCLKTYPKTEEDLNQNVDITSFMVETHINVDDRTDENRGNFNIMSRPTNFNLFNSVYDSLNDVFIYATKSSDLITSKYPNQFIWTLSKNYLGEVDTWTNASFLALNQCKYPITKLCNYNDKIFSFNTKSLECIDFNSKSFIQSSDGFVELQNNNKVLGTITVSDTLGTNNSSIQITEKGIYFVEDNERNIIRLNQDGSIFRIGVSRMESWMKKNINIGDYNFNNTNNIHLEYDPINKELHILNDTYCLIYNETIESFTSFIDLTDTMFMFSFGGNLYSLGHLNNGYLYGMYSGNFNVSYDNVPIDYSLHYRVNPEINTDKVFTNIEFTADLDVNDYNSHKSRQTPFSHIRAWNEYQDTTVVPLTYIRDYVTNLKQKFRTWRADIPRNKTGESGTHRDRIRNPWIHLLLSKTFNADENRDVKMELHNLSVQYMS